MGKRVLLLCLCLSLLLGGCAWFDGSYLSVMPHREQSQTAQTGTIHVENYQELVNALEKLVDSGAETGVIGVGDYQTDVEKSVKAAVQFVMSGYPIGAFAVDTIDYELGTSGGQDALAVTISYRRSLGELQQIRRVADMEAAETAVEQALQRCDAGVVLLVDRYATRDMTQLVRDFAEERPQTVMEVPQVTENIYGAGRARVIELVFAYQNGRDDLRQMQSLVEPVFNSAVLYVSGDDSHRQKYTQLYAFLMERFDYTIETSITPAYSLLRHGVGDSRAFATVYAAMCRSAGLECRVVTGTRQGEPWTWNMVTEGENYCHVDLLRSSELGGYREWSDWEMSGYVWDYSAYPACDPEAAPAAETEQNTAPPAETAGAEELPTGTGEETASEPETEPLPGEGAEDVPKEENF